MKRPDNWLTLPRHELVKLAHDLNVWNANQPISNAAHDKHYREEIAPIHKRCDVMWEEMWIRIMNK